MKNFVSHLYHQPAYYNPNYIIDKTALENEAYNYYLYHICIHEPKYIPPLRENLPYKHNSWKHIQETYLAVF